MENGVSTLSLTRLEEVANRAEALRACLRGAFLNDTPRVEVTVFTELMQLLEIWLPFISSSATETQSTSATRNIIAESYLQEIFAALLFLADEFSVHMCGVSAMDPPRLQTTSVPKSEFYVDLHTRRYCAELLVFLCFSRVCRTHRIVQALYPLFLSGDCVTSGGVSQNHVGEGLFNSPRFQKKKTFVSSLLNGVVMSLLDGAMALLRVLLLDDRVEDGMTAEAAEHIARLFATPLRRAWVLKEGVVALHEDWELEEQVRLLSAQLIHLMASVSESCAAGEVEKAGGDDHLPEFVRQQRQLQERRFLKPETVEERLHLGIATILNAVLRLQPRGENKELYKRSYRCFCFYNKHFLTPAFRVLSLRSSIADDTDEILLALRRLTVLARGSTLGPSSRALLLTLEPVLPGLLELHALSDTLPPPHLSALSHLLESLWKMEGQFEEMAHIFVRGVFAPARCSYGVDRVLAKVLIDTSCASLGVRRMRSLRSLLLRETTPKDFLCKVLMAAAAICQQRAATANDISTEVKASSKSVEFLYTTEEAEAREEIDEEVMLVRMVEEMCVGLGAEEVFGTRIGLDHVCHVLATVVTISYACWKWAMLLIPRVLALDVIHAMFAQYVTTLAKQKAARALLCQLHRLEAIVNALHDTAVDVGANASLAAAIATVQQYDVDEHDDVSVVVSECSRVVRAAEESLDTRSTASLIVHLLALARMAEETAHHFCRKVAPAIKTGVDDKSTSGNSNQHQRWTVVPSAFCLLARVLAEVDDAYAALTACKAMIWWSLARCDSADSSFVGRLVVDLLCVDEKSPSSLSAVLSTATATLTPPQLGRMKVRLLDVLLGLCDYDSEGRTLRNIDDYCKEQRRCGLFDILAELCGPRHSAVVQVAALHLIGHYVVATYPRVLLSSVCTLCVDVFRHTPHEMAKAACASMLSNVVGSLEKMDSGAAVLSDDDAGVLRRMAEAMCAYRTVAGGDATHEAVVRRHGSFIRDVLRHPLMAVQEI